MCLRLRSTIVPNIIEKNATNSMYAPPMMPVASTDCVSMYTQKVSANQRKLVVTFAMSVFTRTFTNALFARGSPGATAPLSSRACSAEPAVSVTDASVITATDIRQGHLRFRQGVRP